MAKNLRSGTQGRACQKGESPARHKLFRTIAALGIMFSACKHQDLRTPSYGYCIVRETKEIPGGVLGSVWRVGCVDAPDLVLDRIVKEGDQIYFVPFYVDDDSTTLHGYVKSIETLIP